MIPTLKPKLRKSLNADYFELLAPRLTLAKTVLKSYLNVTLGLFQLYIYQTLPISRQYVTNISSKSIFLI